MSFIEFVNSRKPFTLTIIIGFQRGLSSFLVLHGRRRPSPHRPRRQCLRLVERPRLASRRSIELPVTGQADTMKNLYFSGVYVETGSITTSVSGPGGAVVSSSGSSSVPTSTATGTTLSTFTVSSVATPASSSAAGTLPEYSQCGSEDWTGSETCVAWTTCVYSNPYYSQCLA